MCISALVKKQEAGLAGRSQHEMAFKVDLCILLLTNYYFWSLDTFQSLNSLKIFSFLDLTSMTLILLHQGVNNWV